VQFPSLEKLAAEQKFMEAGGVAKPSIEPTPK
jgi:hypothetical protein